MTKHEGRETILVTGSTGTVGKEVVKKLALSSSDHNVTIRAAVHSKNKDNKFNQYQAVETVNMDYNNLETIANALIQVDKLFLLILATPNMTDIYSNLVKEIKKQGRINHIVMLSSMAVEIKPRTTTGLLHRQGEKIIEESGIPYTFLRPSGFMQNFVNYLGETIRNQNAFYIPAGIGQVSFIDVRDIASVSAQALSDNRHMGMAYTITGQEALSYGQAAEILSKESGKGISYVYIAEEDYRKEMKEIGMDDMFIDLTIEFYSIIRAGYASQTTDTVEKITGRKPIRFTQFAKDYAKYFR